MSEDIDRALLNTDLVILDLRVDSAFLARVVEPTLARHSASSAYSVSAPHTSHRFQAQSAECQRLSYVGNREAELVEADAPLDRAELDDRLGGLLIFTEWPTPSAVAAEPGQPKRARVVELDRGTLDALLVEWVDMALELDLPVPHSLRRRLVAMEVSRPFCFDPSMGEALRRVCADRQYALFINAELVARYASMFGANMEPRYDLVARAPRTSKAAPTVAEDDEVLELPDDPFQRNKLMQLTTGDLYGVYGEDLFAVQGHRLEQPPELAKRRELEAPRVAAEKDDDDDDDDTESVAMSETASINSLASDIEPIDEQRTATLRFDRHEFSDRLFENAADDQQFVMRRPHPRFVGRCQLVLCASHVLLTHLCDNRPDAWRATDLFYLVELAWTQARSQPRDNLPALCPPAAGLLKAIRDKRLAFNGVESTPAIGEAALAVLRATADDRQGISDVARRLFAESSLHHVLDTFQISATTDYRRAHAEMTEMTHATPEELDAFVEAHALASARALIARRRREATDESTLTDVVLRFSAVKVTPLELLTSVRAWSPSAEDGRDFLVVWAPGPYELSRRVPGATSCTAVYLTMKRAVWRVIALGAVPRLLAEQRSRTAPKADGLLLAPFLHAALSSTDTDVLTHAIAALQALLTSARGAQPVVWRPATEHSRREAAACVRTFNVVCESLATHKDDVFAPTDALARSRIISRLSAPLIALVGKRFSHAYLAEDSAFAPLLAALAGDVASLVMKRTVAREIVADPTMPAPLVRFLREQLALTAPLSDLLDERQTMQRTQSLAYARNALFGSNNFHCRCGASMQDCTRMHTMLATRRALEEHEDAELMGLDKFQVLECCECSAYAAAAMAANQKEWERKKKRERTPRVLCSWCARRGTMPINAIPADYVLLYNACEAAPSDPQHYGVHRLLQLFTRLGQSRALEAIRVCRGSMIVSIIAPRDSARRRIRNKTTDDAPKGRGGRRPARDCVLENTHASLARVASTGGRAANRDRLTAIVTLEMLAFTPHQSVKAAAAQSTEALERLLAPYSADELTRIGNMRDVTALAEAGQSFPLCRSAITETMSMGAYTFETTASVETLTTNRRAAMQLYRGRFPAPLAESAPFLLPIALCNFHTDQSL